MQRFSANGVGLVGSDEATIESHNLTAVGNMMEQGQSPKSAEQRRKLLKSALAASSVAGLGYSGGALAVASVSHCILNQTYVLSAASQFSTTKPTYPSSPWVWAEIYTHQYQVGGNGRHIVGFKLPSGKVYKLSDKTLISNAVQDDQNSFQSTPVYVIVYFHNDGSLAGMYPEITQPMPTGTGSQAGRIAQASVSCASSLGVLGVSSSGSDNLYGG